MKMKNAPFLEDQNNTPFDEMLILAGTEAWQAWGKGEGQYWHLLTESLESDYKQKPVILDRKQLNSVQSLRIAPKEKKYIKIVQFGKLTEDQLDSICINLAKNTQAEIVAHCNNIGDLIANLSDRVERIRSGESVAEKVQAIINPEPDNKTLPYIEYREGKLNGLYYVIPKFDTNGVNYGEKLTWLCDDLRIIGRGIGNTGEFFYIFEWLHALNKKQVQEAIPISELGKAQAWDHFKRNGLRMSSCEQLKYLVEYFHLQAENSLEWSVTNMTGWHNGAYLLPNGEIIGTPTKPIIFTNKSANSGGYDTKGTLASWQQEIAYYVNKNTSMMLGIATALASPLLRVINAKSFGVHLFNSSSKGKTTTLNIANSLYGNPDLIDLSWNTTPTALSNEAAARNDGFITLDELGQAKKIFDVENIAYSLFNEKGRARGLKEGGNDELSRWKITALSTGEKDVEGFLKSKGIDINAGQLIRLLNVPLIEANHLYSFTNNKEHADHLNEASLNHYGVIGREWIAYIAENESEIKATYQRYKQEWLARLPEEAAAQVQRVAANFAILETALQMAKHLTLWNEADNRECLIKSFNDWLADFGSGDREEFKIIEYFNGWLEESAESCFIQIPEPAIPKMIPKILGYRILEGNGIDREHFYIYTKSFTDKISESGYPKKLVFEVMERNKMIRQGKEQKTRPYQHKAPTSLEKKINSKGKRFYIVYPALIDDEED
ncbi:hypothetical protein QV09_01775 [Gallibacterium salpingitidis]|uniref:DUF927 domain-containing protein n=1 Tax=Gallibacterium salpingitidis TaxID=505341 RepID=A0AB36E4Y1_9PAST|nr:DUF927 domain-containing protein [Gallibacterium salpingitidis]OBX11614.1 hypothetical protein QV09_01775 [Gallibacterium salpingitidis]WKS99022.1 DUF927 domain-containing protein [Gallibacterium salpingitidis]